MATDPTEIAANIQRHRQQQQEMKDALQEVFGSLLDWRRLASGSFTCQIQEGVRAVVAVTPKGMFQCNVRVGSRIMSAKSFDTPQEALEHANRVKTELNSG